MNAVIIKKCRHWLVLVFVLHVVAVGNGYGQELHTPYPIIFVHGLSGAKSTWIKDSSYDLLDFLNEGTTPLKLGGILNISLDYERNQITLGSNKENDVHLFPSEIIKGDMYVVDFNYHASGDIAGRKYTTIVDAMVTPLTKMFIVNDLIFHVGDIIRIRDEFLLVEAIDERSKVINVKRGMFNTIPGEYYTQDGDVFVWNISNESNNSAIAKQGLGLKLAIEKVKEVTGAKKVILLCHSMGGLTAREYIRSYGYNKNDIAKFITIGTPHYGSNLAAFPNLPESLSARLVEYKTGTDIKSDAVRDLKTGADDIINQIFYGKLGIFLYGGNEQSSSSHYYDKDIDCNGNVNDQIIGLCNPNIVNSNIGGLFRTWIVSSLIDPLLNKQLSHDGVVLTQSQFINKEDTLMTKKFHLDEPTDIYSLIRGLDEPDEPEFAYEIGKNSTNKGFITFVKNNDKLFYIVDLDWYKVTLDEAGLLKFNILASSYTGITSVNIYKSDADTGEPVAQIFDISKSIEYEAEPGTYYIRIRGLATSGANASYKFPYTFTSQFSPIPTTTLTILPNSVQFYDGVIGTPKGKTITLTNNGTDNVFISKIALTGSNADQFSASPMPPILLAPGTSMNEIVTFNPTSVGEKVANLEITINNEVNSIKTVSLKGTGVDQPTKVLGLNYTTYNFGSTKVNTTRSKTFTIQNTGSNAVIISNIAIEGLNPDPYTIVSPTVFPFDLESGVSKSITVKFAPTSIGSKSALLAISNNSENISPKLTLELYGNGTENYYSGNYNSLTAYEYWFDDQYATKVVKPITLEKEDELMAQLSTEGLNTGLHSMHIRYKDQKGKWSAIASEFFHKLPVTADGIRKIVACEYWFDETFDSKVSSAINDGQVISFDSEIDLDSLTTGLHSYHVRYKDDAGQWSSVVSEFFHKLPVTTGGTRKITASEYWFDEAYDSKVLSTVTDEQVVSINSGVDVKKLSPGLHSYHVRYKDDAGLWSSVVSEFFHKLPIATDGTRKITASEYWFDDAYTNKVTTPVTEGQVVSVNSQLELGNLSNGLHRYHVRYKDDAGQWSSVVSEFFHKLPATTSAGNLITTYRYWFDTNSQAMSTVDLSSPANPYQLIRNINTCNITDGNHTLHFQFRDSNKQWSSVASTTVAKSAIVVPTITANGATTICQGSSIALTSSEAETYLWSNGATTQSIIVSEAGNYSVIVNQGTSCALTSEITTITVNTLPLSGGAISGNSVVAKGQSITYTVSPISNASSYTWTLPEGATGVSTSNSITISFGENAVSGEIKVKGHNDCGDGPESSLAIMVSDVLTQTLTLNAGWNIISSYVTPSTSELKTVFQPLIDSGKLKKVMDESGKTLENFGAFGGWKNNIGNWMTSEGYKVNVTQSCSLTMEGSPVPLPMDINLNAGWNIISYPSASMQDAMVLFQSLITAGKLKKVMDESGRSLENFGAFGGWKNNIGNLMPGKGYKVNMTTSSVLTIPADGIKSASVIPQVLASTHFKPVYQGNGTDHMNIHFVDLAKSGIRQGDEIGIFDGKLCVGSATVGMDQIVNDQISLAASANDGLQQKSNGFTKGHRVGLKLYRELKVYDMAIDILNNSAGTFESGESLFARVRGEDAITGEEESQLKVKCYPNPFSKEVSIEVQPGKVQKMEVSVYDVNGKMIKKLYKGEAKEKKVLVWDGKNERGDRMVTGIYFIHVNNIVEKVSLR